jgi:hypothetical protein
MPAQGLSYGGPFDPAAATAWLADHVRPTVIKTRERGGTRPPIPRRPGGRRRPSPAPTAGAVDRQHPAV